MVLYFSLLATERGGVMLLTKRHGPDWRSDTQLNTPLKGEDIIEEMKEHNYTLHKAEMQKRSDVI